MFRVRLYTARLHIRTFSASAKALNFKAERPSEIKQLTSPIGENEPPRINDNDGTDPRNLKQKWKDLTNPEKNKARREELKKEFAESSFKAIYGFRHTGGKFFTSPKEMFPEKEAKYIPNLVGHDLNWVKTGLVQWLGESPTIVRLFSSSASKTQIDTYTEDIDLEKVDWNLVDVNIPTSWLNEQLVRFFSSKIKATLVEPQHRYLVCRQGITPSLRETIWATNELGGYLYVVDKDYKIRWAASGTATDSEKNLLRKILRQL